MNIPNIKFTIPNNFKSQINKKCKLPNLVGGVIRKSASVIKSYHTLPGHVSLLVKLTALPKILCAPLFIHDAYKNICNTGAPNRPLKDRVRSIFTLIINIDDITGAIASVLEILNKAKVIGAKAVEWIPIFNIVSFYIRLVALGFAIESTHKARRLYQSLHVTENELNGKNNEEKIKILIRALNELQKNGIEPLRKKLMLSKKTKLNDRIVKIADILNPPKSTDGTIKTIDSKKKEETIEAGEKLMRILASRAKSELIFSGVDLTNRIVGVVGSVFETFTPFPVVGYAILAGTGTVSLGLWGSRFLLVNKDPFNPESKNRAQKLLSRANQTCKDAVVKLNSLCTKHNPQLLRV